jgi:hypothetical protein
LTQINEVDIMRAQRVRPETDTDGEYELQGIQKDHGD